MHSTDNQQGIIIHFPFHTIIQNTYQLKAIIWMDGDGNTIATVHQLFRRPLHTAMSHTVDRQLILVR